MPTDTVKSVGTGGDYTSWQAWEDATSTLSTPDNLVSSDVRYIGEQKNEELTGNLTVSGQTVDSTRYMYLRCQTGASFSTNASVRSNALDYNSSNGAAAKSASGYTTVWVVMTDYTRLEGLQLNATNSSSNTLGVGGAHIRVTNCVIVGGNNVFSLSSGASDFLATNTLVRHFGTGASGASVGVYGGTAPSFIGCSFVRSSGLSPASTGLNVLASPSAVTVKDCAVFNFSTFASGSFSATYCATDLSAPSGSGNVGGLTYSAQFVSTTTDFRAKSGGGLENAGTPDSTNIPTDISNTTRSVSTPTIGAWELSSSPPPPIPNRIVAVNQAVKTAVY